MNPERWEQAKAIFGSAIELEPERRRSHVHEACAGDEELFAEVMSLVNLDAGRTVLRNPVFSVGISPLLGPAPGRPMEGTAPGGALPWTSDKAEFATVPSRFDAEVERDYAAEYFRLSLPRLRGALILGIAIYGGFAVVDKWVGPGQYVTLWSIRAILVALATITYAFSYAPQFLTYWQPAITLLVAIGSIGILVMIAIIPVPGTYLYYAGLLLATVYYCTLVRPAFVWAVGLSAGIFLLYLALALWQGTPAVVIFTNVMMLAGGNAIALLANFALEQHSRRDFWQRRVIESRTKELEGKNVQLSAANSDLIRSREEVLQSARRNELLFIALTEALPGTVLDEKYRLDEKIGAGGFGTVYKGFHLLLQRPVAVKLLKPTGGDVSAHLAAFRKEGIAGGLLVHPNIVRVFDFGVSAGSVAYLVMELLEGQPLSQALEENGSFDLLRTCDIVRPLCSGLSCAHETGLIHCDLKPSNIFLHKAGDAEVVKIIDFGVAKIVAPRELSLPSMSMSTSRMGTPAYMAPERLLGKEYDSRADVYSLGVMVYELLSGKKPFAAPSGENWAMALAQLTEAPPPLSQRDTRIPDAVGRIVDRALARDPGERPSAEEFGTSFLRAAAGARSSADTHPEVPRAS